MAYIATRLEREFIIDAIITIHYFEYSTELVFNGESHDFWEILYVDRGVLEVTTGSSACMLSAGEIIFHEPHEFHAFRSIGNKPPNLFVCSFLCASSFLDFFRHNVFRLTSGEQALIFKIIDTARACFSTPLDVPSIERVELRTDTIRGYPQMISIYLELLLLTIYQNRQQMHGIREKVFIADVEETSREHIVQQITKYMEEHITEKLTLEELCSIFSISCSTLENLFQQKTGYSPITFFNLLKIDKAKSLIREEVMNITEIAYYLSYSSLPHFSRQFKKVTGISPKEYQGHVKEISYRLRYAQPTERGLEGSKASI